MIFPFLKTKIFTSTIAVLLIAIFIAAPISPHGELQEANAQLTVEVVGDVGDIQDIWNYIENAYTALQTTAISWNTFQDWVKEYILDPLFWALVEAIITGILEDMIMWVNSGFEGDPQFITNFEDFLVQAADEAAGDFIYGTELGFLCDPFELDIRIALSIQYATYERDYQPQCTLSQIGDNFDNFINGTFVDGGWVSWFEFTQGPNNSPISAYNRAVERLRRELEDATEREATEAAANEFWLAVEICGFSDVRVVTSEDTEVPSEEEECLDGTPGSVVNRQVNEWLGVSSERLAFADEFDELVGALLSQLGNQLLMGVNGLLGLGGSSSYTSYDFGNFGGSSYLQALREESNAAANPIGGPDVMQSTIDDQEGYLAYQEEIIEEVEDVEEAIRQGEDDYPECFTLELDDDLEEAKSEAELEALRTQASILELEQAIVDYQNASTTGAVAIITNHLARVNSGEYIQGNEVRAAQFFVEFDLPPMISAAESAIASERARCQQLEEEERRRQEEQNNGGNDR